MSAIFTYFTNQNSLKKCFLFHLKSSSCSRDIQVNLFPSCRSNRLEVFCKKSILKVARVAFTDWPFYNLVTLIKWCKIRYLNLDKALFFPRNQVICLKNWKLWQAPTNMKINIFFLKFCTRTAQKMMFSIKDFFSKWRNP